MADESGWLEDQPVKNIGGRPHALSLDDATLAHIEGLGRLNCTHTEAGAFFGITEKTFQVFIRDNPAAKEAYETGKGNGMRSLRRKQWMLALDEGNVTMLIWLGKQHLGQKDKMEQSGDPEAPVRHVVEYIITDPAPGGDSEVPSPEGFHER